MKILVFDDTRKHRESANLCLGKEHELTVVGHYDHAQEVLINKGVYGDFDVVMTDLMVPASDQAQGREGERFVGQEMPIGAIIALLAISNGVKKVAVVTDMNHHNHPASAAFDCFRGIGGVGDVTVLCTNRVEVAYIDSSTGELVEGQFLHSPEGKKKHPYVSSDSVERQGITRGGKNWKKVLDELLGKSRR